MKIQTIHLKNFKRFRDRFFDFTDSETGLAKELIVLVGMNGSGKTSLLQAIAATLGPATGRLQTPRELNWLGLELELVDSHWQRPLQVNLEVEFSPVEITATQEFYENLRTVGNSFILPSDKKLVTLTLQQDVVKTNTPAELFQFKGREYAKQIVKEHPDGYKILERVGTVFWYTEQRSAASLTVEDNTKRLEISDNLLRDRLSKAALFHQQVETGQFQLWPGQKDFLAEFQTVYQKIFPHHRVIGPRLRSPPEDWLREPWFYLTDGQCEYEISELSGGERAIFPILFDLVSWNIHNSVILIDEIDLHLHPPAQQAFLRALRNLGKNNQFIITTHSDYIAQLLPQDDQSPYEAIIQLEE
jgi:predicted ATP-dependent endonuclease of OLD family